MPTTLTDIRNGLAKLREAWRGHSPFAPLNPSCLIERGEGRQPTTLGQFAVESLLRRSS